MGDLVPSPPATIASSLPQPLPSLLAPLTDAGGGPILERLRVFARQAPVRRMLPWFVGLSAIGGAALAWSAIAPSPQRTLYSQLDDTERASVVQALDKASIGYRIDNQTGALTVDDTDYFRARMLVASDNALATPETGSQLLDNLPIGASRTLEGERLREARERDLMLTIAQIDGVEAVRVHLAEAERSVFVRDDSPPSASVMVRLARGRQLSESQVAAITSLVAASVPGLLPDAVRVVDQSGRLLSASGTANADRLELQARLEEKLRGQLSQLLTPMIGDGNFSSEIQVDLDMDQVTTARESYDKQGAVRSETVQQSQSTTPAPVGGIPGVLANTPPPPTTAQAGPPQGSPPGSQPGPVNNDASSSKTYELGREVSVADTSPGRIRRLSVAVAISPAKLGGMKPQDLAQLRQLISAAVGANPARGDQVEVMLRNFAPVARQELVFYEAPWFAPLARSVVALLAVLLVLLLAVRPLQRSLARDKPPIIGLPGEIEAATPVPIERTAEDNARLMAAPLIDAETGRIDPDLLSRKVGLAQQLVAEKPDSALAALRQMLAKPTHEEAAA